jgi:hypothetical protein
VIFFELLAEMNVHDDGTTEFTPELHGNIPKDAAPEDGEE